MTLPERTKQPEPWLRGTHAEGGAVKRAVLHALELAGEDIQRWCENLSEDELNARPAGIAPIVFHLRHVARSLDRLITYAEGAQLDVTQMDALKSELDSASSGREALEEFSNALTRSAARIRAIDPGTFENSRAVGRRRLPTTVGGLLMHIADHTQRHVGQAITTAKVVMAQRS